MFLFPNWTVAEEEVQTDDGLLHHAGLRLNPGHPKRGADARGQQLGQCSAAVHAYCAQYTKECTQVHAALLLHHQQVQQLHDAGHRDSLGVELDMRWGQTCRVAVCAELDVVRHIFVQCIQVVQLVDIEQTFQRLLLGNPVANLSSRWLRLELGSSVVVRRLTAEQCGQRGEPVLEEGGVDQQFPHELDAESERRAAVAVGADQRGAGALPQVQCLRWQYVCPVRVWALLPLYLY